jgi:tetratricopeptide repeat protein
LLSVQILRFFFGRPAERIGCGAKSGMKPAIPVGILLLLTRGLAAQTPDSVLIYAKIVANEPDNARAVFRLASLRPRGSPEAISLLERYVRLEPGDASGQLALAEAYAAAGRFDAALQSLARAAELAPEERDVAAVRQRIERAQRGAVPTVQPRISLTGDSDNNLLMQWTAAGDFVAGRFLRFGMLATQSRTSGGAEGFSAFDARASFQLRTPTTRYEMSAGGAFQLDYSMPVARARLRWSPAAQGPQIDLRATYAPMLISPLLMNNRAALLEARGAFDLPVFGMLHVRANVQRGHVATETVWNVSQDPQCLNRNPRRPLPGCPAPIITTRQNARTGLGAGLVTRVNPVTEFSANYYQLSYDLPADSLGYFAPRLVQLLELGTYAEVYRIDPLTIAFDLGTGIQRSARHGAELGSWTPALRGWAQLTYPIGRAVELNLESEAYSSQAEAVTTSESWRSVSVSLSFRWLIL